MKKYLKRFKIQSEESIYWFWVVIYDSLEKLRADAVEYEGNSDYQFALGVSHHYIREIFNGKSFIQHNNIGTIRMLNTAASEISAHEVLHSALHNYRVEYKKANFGDQCSDKEEKLCYIFGQLYRQLVMKMYKFRLWK